MIRKVFVSAAALAAMTGAAWGADLPNTKGPAVFAPPPPPAFSWTGFYVGADGGYAWSAVPNNLTVPGDNPSGVSSRGGFGGGEAGYNFEIAPQFVLGVETDFQGTDISDNVQDLNFGDHFTQRLGWFGSVRGRVGYAFDRVLFYATGGFAYGHLYDNVNGPILLGSPYLFSGVVTGYTVGGGIEYAITNNFSVKAEYQYMNFGKHDPVNPAGVPLTGLPVPGPLYNDAFHTVRVGVNYRFDMFGSSTPVVAKY